MLVKDDQGRELCLCDFCGQSQCTAKKLIAGGALRPTHICDVCVQFCVEICEQEAA